MNLNYNYFIPRLLKVEYFDDGNDLTNYINRNGIDGTDIQSIIQLQGGNWALFYWE